MKGLRQQVGDAGHASSTDAHGEWNTHKSSPFDLTLPNTISGAVGGVKVDRFCTSCVRSERESTGTMPKGGWLDPILVRKAREEEMQHVKKHAVHEKGPSMRQCWKETGTNPIKTGWADTNKGTSECQNIRSRWVAKKYNTGPRPYLFSATSPLEGVKLVISEAASKQPERDSALSD